MFVQLAAFSPFASAALRCENLFSSIQPDILPTFLTNTNANLYELQRDEVNRRTESGLKRTNRELLKAVEDYRPTYHEGRAYSISWAQLQSLISHVNEHPVVGESAVGKYQPEDVDIAYCFGRSAYLHLLLSHMGLQKQSILKVWSVGSMRAPSADKFWGFHVTDVVLVSGYGWMAIDTNTRRIQPLRHWFNHQAEMSVDGRLRFYVTAAEKFGVTTGKYDRIQMGLDLPKRRDWYQHYFVDMMKTLRTASLAEQGLKRIPLSPRPPPTRPSETGLWTRAKDFLF